MVLGQLHREDLAERDVAVRDLADKQLQQIAHGARAWRAALGKRADGLLGKAQRLCVVGVERALRAVRPLLRAPAGVERDQPPDRDMRDAMRFELRRHGIGGRRVARREDRGHRGELVSRDAAVDVKAVDPERGEIADGLRVRLALDMEGAAVEMHVAVDDVEADGALGLEHGLQGSVERRERLLNHRVAGRVEARRAHQRRQRLHQADRVEALVNRGLASGRRRRAHDFLAAAAAFLPRRMRAGLQKR